MKGELIMNTKISKFKAKRIFTMVLVITLVLSLTSFSAFATDMTANPEAKLTAKNTVSFSNLDKIAVGEVLEFDVLDSEGNPATVGIKRMPSIMKAGSTEWKVWYTGVTINAHFYMTVSNNKVTSVYDEWILIIGGTYDNEKLTKTSTYGKLTFKAESYGGIITGTCWLKGTVTGSNNNIDVTYSM